MSFIPYALLIPFSYVAEQKVLIWCSANENEGFDSRSKPKFGTIFENGSVMRF